MKCTIPKINRKQRVRNIVFMAIIGLAVLLYGLADRYLIEHVEGTVAATATPSITTTASATDNKTRVANNKTSVAAATIPTSAATASAQTNDATAATASGTVKAQSDDWNYNSDNIDIQIKKVQTGTGDDQVTYYVADVQLKNGANLQSAFAKNEFGRNIVETTSEIASNNGAIFAINGDYYGFRSNGVEIRNGVVYRDEPARTGLAVYKNGEIDSYDETEVSTSELLADGVVQTFSFGPVLIGDGKTVTDFAAVKIDKNFGNRSIQECNPRTGIGMISSNHYIFIVVDGRSDESHGVTLEEFARMFADCGCSEAYNLDGGGSSTMYFMGRVVNNPQGGSSERGVSDIVYLAE